MDEGDIVKNDGNYLYVLNDDRVTIVDIRDKNMRKLSEIRPELTENDILLQLYVDNDRLYVIKQGWETQQEEIQSDSTELTMIPVLSDVIKISLMNRTEM